MYCGSACRVRAHRRRHGTVGGGRYSSRDVALDFDGLPRLSGGKRFWSELLDAVHERAFGDLVAWSEEGLSYINSSDEQRQAREVVAVFRQELKLGAEKAVKVLQSETNRIRRKGQRRRKELQPTHSREEVEDAFDTLGLPVNSTLADAKRAYRQQVKLYHPDTGGPPDAMIAALEAFKIVEAAIEAREKRSRRRSS